MAKAKKEAALTPEERLQAALVPDWEWPYKLPENWCWTYLTKAAECLDNFRKPINATERAGRNGNVPYYGATGQVGWIDDFLTDEDLVLLGEDGAPFLDLIKDKAYLITGKAWVNNHAHILRSLFGDTGNRYLLHYLNSFNYAGYVNGTTRLKLTQANMDTIPIPLPPLAEQQRIVDRIESLFAKLDEAKEKAQAVVDSFETRKAAILHKAFTGELTKKWRKSANTRWAYKKIKDCCKLGSGGTPSRKVPDFYKGDIPWIKTGEIEWNDIYDTEEKITQSAIDNSSARCYKPGVVLVAMYGMGVTRGKASILRVQAATNQAVCVLEPQSALLYNRYLLYYFMRNYWDIREKAVGGNQLNLSLTIIKELNIEIPPIDEQMEVVQILDDLFAKEQQAKESAEVVLDQIDLMKKSILARAFRGELGTNDPSEESAVELIKQCVSVKIPENTLKKKRVKKTLEVGFVAKNIMQALSAGAKLTPEKLKAETDLPIDDFYDQLKILINGGHVIETRIDGESYLEAKNEDR